MHRSFTHLAVFTYSTVIHLRLTKWSSGDGMHKHNIISVNRKRIWTKKCISPLYCVSALVHHVSFLHSWLVCLLFQGQLSFGHHFPFCQCIFYARLGTWNSCFGFNINDLSYSVLWKAHNLKWVAIQKWQQKNMSCAAMVERKIESGLDKMWSETAIN